MSAGYPLPLVFAAWGFRSGGDRWRTADELANYCDANGVKTVAVQLGVETTRIGRQLGVKATGEYWTTADEARTLRERGLRVVVWGVASYDYVVNELQRLGASASDWLPQIEGASQRDAVLDCADRGLHPYTIVTTYSGAGAESGDDVQMLYEAGVETVLVECYASDDPVHADLDRMLWQGTQYGWRSEDLFAVVGTYRGEMPDAYTGLVERSPAFGIYLAEPMSGEQWYAFGDVAENVAPPDPQPPTPEGPMPQVTDTQCRDSVCTAAQAWEQNQADYTPRARLTVCRRIAQAANTNDQWYPIRDQIVALLDQAGLPK